MKTNKVRSILATLGTGLVLVSASAMAGIVYYDPITVFEDNNLDWLEDNDSDNLLSVGDRLISVFQIDNTLNGTQTLSSPITGGELTGIVVVEVATKVNLGFNDPITGLAQFSFTYKAPTNGLDFYLPTDLPGTLGDIGDGTAVAAYWDTSPDLGSPPICGSLADCIANAGDGDLWEADTFDLTAGGGVTGWGGSGADDILGVAGAPQSSKVAFVNFILNVAFNGTGQQLGPQMIGSADILGGAGLTNGAFARSDTDFQKNVSIPEPGTLAMLAAGLVGFGAAQRRRRKA